MRDVDEQNPPNHQWCRRAQYDAQEVMPDEGERQCQNKAHQYISKKKSDLAHRVLSRALSEGCCYIRRNIDHGL
jgi:hypothetical protein